MISEEEDAKNWDWLPDKYAVRLGKVRAGVEKLWVDHERDVQLQWFTPHGPAHCSSVEDLIHRLIPTDASFRKLAERERFYLLASAWVHDIGMIKGIDPATDRYLSDEAIRATHHIRSENYIVNHYPGIGVDEEDSTVLGRLARSHGDDLANCPEETLAGGHVVRLRLLAAYLRLADALDVSHSRAPAREYAICLAYNIPMSSKLHWIKSRLVSGIEVTAKNHRIRVHFKIPYTDSQTRDGQTQKRSLERLQRLVMDDLRSSVETNMPTLIREGITYYFDIDHRTEEMAIDSQVQPELNILTSNLDMLAQPSATKLMRILLDTIDSRAQTYRDSPTQTDHAQQAKEQMRNELTVFMADIRKQILDNRPCHLGFRKLVERLETLVASPSFTIRDFTETVVSERKRLEDERKGVRTTAEGCFKEFYPERTDNKLTRFVTRVGKTLRDGGMEKNMSQKLMSEMQDGEFINILVYGFSELVIKAICGYRDHVARILEDDPEVRAKKAEYKETIEAIASTLLRVFVCEGQPKTITAKNDRLTYHDGAGYALDLSKRNFNNIMMLPDLVAASLKCPLDFVMLGVNGLQYEIDMKKLQSAHFYHTSGHSAITILARHLKQIQPQSPHEPPNSSPRVVLVLTRSKCAVKGSWSQSLPTDEPQESEGYKFWARKGDRIRTQPFLTRDEDVRADLYRAGIRLYNPKEDEVDLTLVDDVIANDAFFIGVAGDGRQKFREWLSRGEAASSGQVGYAIPRARKHGARLRRQAPGSPPPDQTRHSTMSGRQKC